MNQKLIGLVGVFFLVLTVNKTSAVEEFSAVDLEPYCAFLLEQADSVDGQFCIGYIQGFVGGAVAIEEPVLLKAEAEFEKKDTCGERAARIRGVSAADRAEHYPGFCLDDHVSLREVVTIVVSNLRTTKLVADAMARAAVFSSLLKTSPVARLPTTRIRARYE
jgi:hypothetical protein